MPAGLSFVSQQQLNVGWAGIPIGEVIAMIHIAQVAIVMAGKFGG